MRLDAKKIAGAGLPKEEAWIDPEDILDGVHQPRSESLFRGDQLIVEVYEDGPGTYQFAEPFMFDEFVQVQSGRVILTETDGEPQEFVTGDSFVVPKGWTGTWQMFENYRELIVVQRDAYEAAFGASDT